MASTSSTVHFAIGSQSDYDSLQTKDSNTLYFISEGKIYKGSDLMGTKNSVLTSLNTTNVNTTIDGNEISMNLTSGFLDSVNNAGSQWGEIPLRNLTYNDINPNEEYALWIYSGFLLIKMWDYYYWVEWNNINNLIHKTSTQDYILGSNIIILQNSPKLLITEANPWKYTEENPIK